MALDDRVVVPDERIESLISENEPDSMEGEQTWPTDEEIADAEKRVAHMQAKAAENGPRRKKVPKGTSAYQAAWITNSDDESEDEDMDAASEEEEHEFINVDADRSDVMSVAPTTVGDFQELEEEEEGRQYQEYLAERKKQQESKDHLEFPDETDTPQDISARVRFQRYNL